MNGVIRRNQSTAQAMKVQGRFKNMNIFGRPEGPSEPQLAKGIFASLFLSALLVVTWPLNRADGATP